MATVHLGRLVGERGFARTVAIKRLHPHFANTVDFVSMLLDEARVAGRIRHPNVVPVIDVVSKDCELVLVMEYVPGETLARLLRRAKMTGERVPPEIAASIVCDVLDGLHAAHETRDERGDPLGVVHRDVSPQNIIVGTDGIARVVDFGLARAVGRLQETREGQLKGKLPYMAPEQFQQQASRASDIYAASVVLWEVLTAQKLFHGETEVHTAALVLAGKVEPPSHIAGTSTALDDIVLRGLATDPSARFATAQEMSAALAQCVTRAERRVVADWCDTLAHDSLATRAALVSAIESPIPTKPMVPISVIVPQSKVESDSIVVSKRTIAIIVGGTVTLLVAILLAVTNRGADTENTAQITQSAASARPHVYDDLPPPVAPPPIPTHVAPPVPTVTAPASTTSSRRSRSNFAQASELAMGGDSAGARAILEPIVFGSNKAGPEEVKLLRGICKQQHDRNCSSAIDQRYPSQ